MRRLVPLLLLAALAVACGSGSSGEPPDDPTTTTTTVAGPTTTLPAGPAPTTTAPPGVVVVTVAPGPDDLGPILVDGGGFTLYAHTGAEPCTGLCAQVWPPAGGARAVAGPGVDPLLVTSGPTTDGVVQAVVAGRPLHRFAGDLRPGEAFGQGVDGEWFAVTPTGLPLVPPPAG